MEVKYFITYGNWRNFENMEGPRKAMEEYKKTVKEAGLELVFWGAAFGVSENALCVLKGNHDGYMKLMGSGKSPPWTDSRTHWVLTW